MGKGAHQKKNPRRSFTFNTATTGLGLVGALVVSHMVCVGAEMIASIKGFGVSDCVVYT